MRSNTMTDTPGRADDQETFGARLRHFRTRAGLTQEMLAERASVSVAAIAALEQGLRRRPYPHTLVALSRGLALEPADHVKLLAPGARETGPATSSQTASPAQTDGQPHVRLPTSLTPLIGREADIATVAGLLQAPNPATRLVTLIGPGGVGKTRLAVAVAATLAAAYPDGVVFVDLAPLLDHRLITATIASALSVYEAGTQSAWDLLVAYLHDRHVLLVLDNFEHVLDGAQVLGELLMECPGVALLATSRIALRLRAERRFAVEPLGQPPEQSASLEAIAASPAVRLFVERAGAVAPLFALDSGNAGSVAAVCRRLGSIPLAIELAAARVGVLGVAPLLQRLDRPLPLLTAGAPDLPERQRTLRNTLAWSHALLGIQEQVLFRRLAVFVGGWTVSAAEAVCSDGDLPIEDVLGRLEALVDHSLIRHLDAGEEEPRFTMLEVVREYAVERSVECGEWPTLRARHRDWCLTLAEEAAPELNGPQQASWLERLDRALDNLRVALSWIYEEEQIELGLRLAGALARFWSTRRYVTEGRDWLERFLAPSSARGMPAALQAQASYAVGVLASIQGDCTYAAGRLEESIELYRLAGDAVGAVRALNTRGGVSYDQGHLAFAAALWAQSLAQARVAGDLGEAAHALGNLGEAYFQMGDLTAAATAHTEALAIAQRAGRADLQAMQHGNLGNVARERGDLRTATALQRQALVLKHRLGARRQIAITLEDLASIAGAEGRGTRAAHLLGAASAIRDAIATPQPVPERTATEQAVAAARAALGEDAWNAAWTSGKALTLEQAMAYGLEQAGG
jgi:predicted ATPase/transcriptional regulator with XRE-family HTH domain